MKCSPLPIARWSGAILLPNRARSASSAAIGSAFSVSQRFRKKHAGTTGGPTQRDRVLEARLDAARRIHHEQRAVGGREAGDHLGDEVRVAGRVDERDPRRVVLERRDREAQRLLALLLLGLVVEVGRAVVDATETRDGAGAKEELLGERRLAAAGVAGQDDAPEVGGIDALHRHRRSGPHDFAKTGGRTEPRWSRRAGHGPPALRARSGHATSAILPPAMSGHSKWSTIKRQKGVTDAKRSAVFTKVAREISVAARQGGGDPDANYRLRLAIEKARSVNMPADNIKRTIDKATGGGDAEQFEEIVYEGYGPGGVAVLVEAATDNRNRTAAEVRSIFTKTGGQLAGSGAVAWQFEPRGLITIHARRQRSTPTRSP